MGNSQRVPRRPTAPALGTSTAGSVGVQVCLRGLAFPSFGCTPRGGITASCRNSLCHVSRNCQTAVHRGCDSFVLTFFKKSFKKKRRADSRKVEMGFVSEPAQRLVVSPRPGACLLPASSPPASCPCGPPPGPANKKAWDPLIPTTPRRSPSQPIPRSQPC